MQDAEQSFNLSKAPRISNPYCMSKEQMKRVVIDFRKLNHVTVRNAFPLPNIMLILDKETLFHHSSSRQRFSPGPSRPRKNRIFLLVSTL